MNILSQTNNYFRDFRIWIPHKLISFDWNHSESKSTIGQNRVESIMIVEWTLAKPIVICEGLDVSQWWSESNEDLLIICDFIATTRGRLSKWFLTWLFFAWFQCWIEGIGGQWDDNYTPQRISPIVRSCWLCVPCSFTL